MISHLKKLKVLVPYVFILLFSLLGTYLVFYKGLNTGDDFRFHLSNIMEQYNTLLQYHKLSPISGQLAMGLGTGTRLFYSPLPHLSVTIMALIMRIYNLSIISAYKTVLVLSVFISGIFMYRFAMHITSNNNVASLIASACFVLYPYRLFDAFCRLAFAEAYSIMFLPLFFMGLYDVIHLKDKVKTMPFLEVIFGGSLLFLSHNLTAFYAYLAAIIYLLCNLPKIIKLFKVKHYVTYCGVSALLLLGIASIAFVSQFELIHTGLYNLTDRVRMWTDVDKVLTRVGEELDYSGFLNIIYLVSKYKTQVSVSSLVIGLVMYVIACLVFIILDLALSEVKKLKHFYFLISTSVLFILVSLISRRLEIYFGTLIFYLLYQYIVYCFKHPKDSYNNNEKIYKNVMFWYCLSMIILLFFMMQEKWIWTVLPSFMLNIQFPWRLWALIQLYVSILIALICHYLNAKKVGYFALAIIVGLLMVANEPLFEKRLVYENNPNSWFEELDDSLLDAAASIGWNKEYCPQVFFEKGYKSEYSNSLYSKVSARLPYAFDKYPDYYFEPVILSGSGNITINDAYSPNYTMDISIDSEEALIQMPLIYYPGYKVIAIDNITNEKTIIKGENIDGLVSFALSNGDYSVTTKYVGTTARKISIVCFSVCFSISTIALIYALFFENKKEKKNESKESK